MTSKKIAFVGNPNVGKSTLFNALTHSHQHTGNWPGKTVSLASGTWKDYLIVDLPGTYSLSGSSLEECVTVDEVLSNHYDYFVVVADATCLERNFVLLFQLMEITKRIVLVLNLMDEAKRKHIDINTSILEEKLGIPVCAMSANQIECFDELDICLQKVDVIGEVMQISYPLPLKKIKESGFCLTHLEKNQIITDICDAYGMSFSQISLLCKTIYHHQAKQLTNQVCVYHEAIDQKQMFLDRLLTGKMTSWLSMGVLLTLLLWITLSLANIPSQFLGSLFFEFEDILANFLGTWMPATLVDLLCHGVYRVLSWVVSVMLPPMAIFFPLFSLLEDFGYLPRMAFNLDACFAKCGTCGKQALTMCMGLGCNAVGVMGARIIESKKDRIIAMMTNAIIPCNGRFPILIQIAAMFFMTNRPLFQAIFLVLVLVVCFGISLFVGKMLCFFFKKETSYFILEMPDFRKPQIKKVLVTSFIEKTLKVLQRAVIVASFAGLVIWLLAHIQYQQQSLLMLFSGMLDPFARFLGIDGVILLAFILGFPANEIVIPLMVMIYLGQGMLVDGISLEALKSLFISQGWTTLTALNVLILTVFHWPCSTTCLTIKKETGSTLIALATVVLMTVLGFGLMFFVRIAFLSFF